MADSDFLPDPKLQPIVEAQAAKAMDAAMTRFSVMLDWSDEGIQHVEDIFRKLAAEIARTAPSPERISKIATAFGCYVGETFRRNHGGAWGTITRGERKSWGLMAADGVLVSPVDQVHKRLTSTSPENFLLYYRSIVPPAPPKSEGMTFTADANIQKIAEAYSLDAVAFAKGTFRIKLDGSDQSVKQIEDILARLFHDIPKSKPTADEIFGMAKMFGSYVGEVYRKNHGGQWGMIDWNGQKFPGIQGKADVNFWPWGKVNNRLTDGPEDNVWHYYQALVQKAETKP